MFPFGFDLDQRAPPPAAFVGVGVGAIFGGLGIMALDPLVKQHGATTQWSPQDPGHTLSSARETAAKGIAFQMKF